MHRLRDRYVLPLQHATGLVVIWHPCMDLIVRIQLTLRSDTHPVNDLETYSPSEGNSGEILTLERVQELVDAAAAGDSGGNGPDGQDLGITPPTPPEKIIGDSFMRFATLNESFSTLPPGVQPTLENPGVSLEHVRKAYHLLTKSKPTVVNAMMLSIKELLRRPGRRLMRVSDLRFLMIILENPLLFSHSNTSEAAFHHSILARAFGLLSCLLNDLHHYVVNWFARYVDQLSIARARFDD
ncbi:putative E3 ubiquitin-protein ligase [Irineochytrium annulatum]|nr:putative E3 ubiquitin-protein ligase [Irineochytrium annulatum]